MYNNDMNYMDVISALEKWPSYENSSNSRDLSKLEGIKLLLKKLGNPEKKKKIIHIAGTNGKGSTAVIISHLLKIHGFDTGCYTSPHLIDIRERIRINGRNVSKKNFLKSASKVLKIAHSFKGEPKLSYFDLLTAIAFHVFMIKKIDWIVLETGLGGRLDSTNVTNKKLCVLTKIGFDHQAILGEQLIDIAKEKIGIARSKVPILIANQKKELNIWLNKQLKKQNVPFYHVDDYFHSQFPKVKFSQNFRSESQIQCIKTSLCAMQIIFNSKNIEKRKWLEKVKKVKITGRLDLRKFFLEDKNPQELNQILIDVSHNNDSILELIDFISKKKIPPFNLIFGMISDKLVNSIKKSLKTLCSNASVIILTTLNTPRTATTKKLENFIFGSDNLKKNHEIKHVNSAEEAIEYSFSKNKKPIVIAGSFYLAGEVIKILKDKNIIKKNKSKKI